MAARASKVIVAAALALGFGGTGGVLAQSDTDSPFEGGVFEDGSLDEIFDDDFAADSESGGDFNVGGSTGGTISIGGAGGGISIGGGSGGSVVTEE